MNAPAPILAAPLVRWVGSKRALIPTLEPCLPATFGTYFEPFFGGGALYWHLANEGRITNAVLADATRPVVEALRGVRGNPGAVTCLLGGWAGWVDRAAANPAQAMEVMEALRDILGAAGSPLYSPSVIAAALLAHQAIGFNGLWRVNSDGRPNVALGADSDGNPLTITVDAALIQACSRALQPATIRHHVAFMGDLFRQPWTLPLPVEGDLAYLDPPYCPMGPTADFTDYTADGFGPANHHQFAAWALEARRRGAHVVISNSDTPLTRRIFGLDGDAPVWNVVETTRSGSVSCKGDGRGRVGELVLWGGAL